MPQMYRLASTAPLELIPRPALLNLQIPSLTVCRFYRQYFSTGIPSLFMDYLCISFLAFESTCRSDNVPSITMPVINTSSGTPQSTPNTATPSTTPVSVTTAVPSSHSQIVIGPSSTTSAPNTALSVGSTSTSTSTSTASIGGLPLNSSASTNKKILNWTVALLGLAVGNLLVFWELETIVHIALS